MLSPAERAAYLRVFRFSPPLTLPLLAPANSPTPYLVPLLPHPHPPFLSSAVVLSPAERTAYLRVHREAADVWAAVRCMSSAAINQKLLQVMSLLQPLRR